MASSVIVRHVAVVRTDVSEELSVSFIKVTRIGVLGTTLAVISNRRTLRRNTRWYLWLQPPNLNLPVIPVVTPPSLEPPGDAMVTGPEFLVFRNFAGPFERKDVLKTS
jgi:hypothetical protein